MANTVLIKRSGTSSVAPTTLESGEIAINYADGKLFYKNSSNSIVGAKLITGISGTTNQISVSEVSGAVTLSLPSSVYVSSLFVDSIEIDTTGATPNYVLAYNGTKFVPTASGGSLANLSDVTITSAQVGQVLKYDGSEWINNLETGFSNSYTTVIGDGSSSTFVITHNFGTREVFVSCRNESSPYENINVAWEATSGNTVTLDFSTVPSSNSVRVNVFASVGSTGASAFSQNIGDGSNTSYTITHNLQTRDVIVAARNTASPYEVIDINWEATTTNTVTAIFSSAPSSGSVRITVYAAAGAAGVTSLSGTANEVEVSQTTGNVTVGLPNNVTVSGQLSSSTLFVDSIEIDTTGATNGQFLKYNGTKFVPDDIPTINTLDDVGDVTITSATPNQYLKWNGSAWINDVINLGTDTDGNYIADLTAGTGVTITHTPGEASNPTVAIGQAVGTTDNVTFNDVIVSGDLTVSGTTTTINTTELLIEDNLIILNTGSAATPSYNAGIEVERGDFTNVQIRWNESTDKWQFTNDGSI